MQLPRVGDGAGLSELAEVVQAAPGYVLELGTDAAALPPVIAELLEAA